MGTLWGPSKDLDYWAARERDLVPPEERRAMALLASISDEHRFSLYCLTGQMPAMGNVTKRFYLIRRFDRVLELEDGRPYRSWCIGTPDRHEIPETDHVVTMKTLLEGEEMAFRETGNPSTLSIGMGGPKEDFYNPYRIPFYGEDGEPSGLKEDDFLDFMDTKREIDRLRSLEELRKEEWDRIAESGPPALEDLLGTAPKKSALARISTGAGVFGIAGGYIPIQAGVIDTTAGTGPVRMFQVGQTNGGTGTIFSNNATVFANPGFQTCYVTDATGNVGGIGV